MDISSLQVCMDSSDWFKGTNPQDEENNTQLVAILESNTSSSPMSTNCMTSPSAAGILDAAFNHSGDLIERRIRPPHEQALKCPRCDSTHTKFCYYNNYSLSQPRYFCKTCRRYWTKGGTLRNIPVGGGCRKTPKKSSSSNNSKKITSSCPSDSSSSPATSSLLLTNGFNQTDLRPANFSDQMSFTSLHSGIFNPIHTNFLLENSINNNPFHEFAENKYESIVGPTGSHGFLGESNFNGGFYETGVNVLCSPYGISASSSNILDRGNPSSLLPFDQNRNYLDNHHHQNTHDHDHLQDIKPNPKILSLEWQDQHNNFGGFGSWTGLMNGYGSSPTNPLV